MVLLLLLCANVVQIIVPKYTGHVAARVVQQRPQIRMHSLCLKLQLKISPYSLSPPVIARLQPRVGITVARYTAPGKTRDKGTLRLVNLPKRSDGLLNVLHDPLRPRHDTSHWIVDPFVASRNFFWSGKQKIRGSFSPYQKLARDITT